MTRVDWGRAVGLGIVCAPFISAALLAIWRGGRALTRTGRNRRTR